MEELKTNSISFIPTQVDRLDREATRLISAALAESTKKKYEATQQRFLNFCKDMMVQPCPCSVTTVLRFLANEKETRGAGGLQGP